MKNPCNNRPDCPCPFCVQVRKELAEGSSPKDQEDKVLQDFLSAYAATV